MTILKEIKNHPTLAQDTYAGAMTALLGLPKSLAFGILIFAPLGNEYISMGAYAGIAAFICGNIITSFFRGGTIVNSGPYSLSALMLLSMVHQLSSHADARQVISLLVITVVLSGLLQVFFGLVKLGTLAKYIPHPVFSGLLNGSALLILWSQYRSVTSYRELQNLPLSQLISSKMFILVMITVLVTVLAYYASKHWYKKIPAPVSAVFLGGGVFYVLAHVTGLQLDSLMLKSIPGGIPQLVPVREPSLLIPGNLDYATILLVSSTAVGMGLVNSLSTFLAQSSSDGYLHERTDPNLELVAQGVANMAAGLWGGISSAGSTSRTAAAYEYAGRTRTSKLSSGIVGLAVLLGLGSWFSVIPLPVLSGILVVLALKLVDPWLFTQVRAASNGLGRLKKDALFGAGVSLLVTLVMVSLGTVQAVGVGVVLSLVIFVNSMARGIIRQEYSGSRFHSNTERPADEMKFLTDQGDVIRILELEGYLYFGTADYLVLRVNTLIEEGVSIIIIDVHRLKAIDSTGLVILKQIKKQCVKHNCEFFISAVHRKSVLMSEPEFQEILFRQINDSLALAEDIIIGNSDEVNANECLDTADVDVLSRLSSRERDYLAGMMELKRFSTGQIIIMEGEPGDSIYFILQGRASLFSTSPEGRYRRFYRLSRGTVFGEMSLFSNDPRSADVIAETETVCYRLTLEQLEVVKKERPEIAYNIVTGVGVLLARRIRINLNIIAQLRK